MEIKITINNKLINVLKKVFTKKNSVFIIAVALFCGGLLIFSQQVVELDTFHDGDIIYAGPINDNFTALKERELGSLGDVDVSGAGEGQVLKYNGTSWEMGTDNTGGLGVWTESGNDIYWNGAGNVGIGTTNPIQLLTIGSTSDTTTNKMVIYGSSGGSPRVISMGAGTAASGVADCSFITSGTSEIPLLFETSTTGTPYERMRILANGNVGIGTTNPQAALDMGSGGIRLGGVTRTTWPTGGSGVWTESGSDIYWDGGGNVGIGTTSPEVKLEVNGHLTVKDTQVNNPTICVKTDTGNMVAFLGDDGSLNDGVLALYNESGTQYLHLRETSSWFIGGNIGIGTTTPSTALDVNGTITATTFVGDGSGLTGISGGDASYGSNASSPNDAVYVDNSGNVGIGTTSPDGKLHVFSGDASGTADPWGDELTLENSGHSGMCIISGTTSRGNIYFQDSGGNRGAIQYNHNGDYMCFTTVGSEKVRIDSTGNVGIGTTSPTSKLQVTGLPIHADNATAIGAGLTAGAFYHNGDGIVRVVY